MPEPGDVPLSFHRSFDGILDSFRTAIAALTWLRAAPDAAQRHFAPWHYIITFDCTVSETSIKVDKSAFVAFHNDSTTLDTPLFAATLSNLCRVITIAVRDIVVEHPDFTAAHDTDVFRFLRHVRNAAAHENCFYFGAGRQRERTLSGLPVRWRNKTIDESVEGKPLFHSFIGTGDLMWLLADVSALANRPQFEGPAKPPFAG